MSEQLEFDEIKSQIQQHLVKSGKYDIINKQLKLQLYESGWYDKVSQLASRELQAQDGDQSMNFDVLFSLVKPKAEEMVPDQVKEDIIEKLKAYLDDVIR